MKIIIDSGAKFIVDELEKNGYEAFIVGGCVRDSIMGRIPNDWDITTNAKPEVVREVFERTIPTGEKHGTITVLVDNKNYEVTTYRIDGKYSDNRRPDSVEYSRDIYDDLSRRDFTINAMAYNDTKGLIDVFGGMEDIENKLIKCVGNPDKRFDEDALRILRAIRFSAKLNFSIEENTLLSMIRKGQNIKNVSIERITKELEEIIEYDLTKIKILDEINISNTIFGDIILNPEKLEFDFGTGYALDLGEDYTKSLKRAICFKYVDNNRLKKLLRYLRYSKKEIAYTTKIHSIMMSSEHDDIVIINNYKDLKIVLKRVLRQFDDINMSKIAIYSKFVEKKLNPSVCFTAFDDIIVRGECFSISNLEINGRDLIENDIAKGEKIGLILNKILDYVITYPEKNNKEILLKYAKEMDD